MPEHPELPFHFAKTRWRLGTRPLVMGILNVTPDSFSDGGECAAPDTAVERGLALAAAGADLLDVGGESTRPGAAPVTAAEEAARVVPVIRELARHTAVPISIDTVKAPVAEAALAAGAVILNSVRPLHEDPGLLALLRQGTAGAILMHMRGTPQTMQAQTGYDDVVGEVFLFFENSLAALAAAGVAPERLVLDPGLGFAKTATQNLELIRGLDRFRTLGRPLLAGPSRKSFIGHLLDEPDPKRRQWGTAAAVAACVFHGADILRVHDVPEMLQVCRVAAACRPAAGEGQFT